MLWDGTSLGQILQRKWVNQNCAVGNQRRWYRVTLTLFTAFILWHLEGIARSLGTSAKGAPRCSSGSYSCVYPLGCRLQLYLRHREQIDKHLHLLIFVYGKTTPGDEVISCVQSKVHRSLFLVRFLWNCSGVIVCESSVFFVLFFLQLMLKLSTKMFIERFIYLLFGTST